MKKKITTFLISTLLLLTIIPGHRMDAAYYSDRRSSINGHSLVGIHVLNFTLHASGYSYAKSGRVTSKWTTSWAIFPNNIQNEAAWVQPFPRGQYAYGSFRNVIGVPSPWGAIGLGHSTHYTYIVF